MAEVEFHEDQVVRCEFCNRYEQVDDWNVYMGYGYELPAGRKRKLLVPWKAEESHIDVEHHRVCGVTRDAGSLFRDYRGTRWRFMRCTGCGKWAAYREDNSANRNDKFQELKDCCPKTEEKPKEPE